MRVEIKELKEKEKEKEKVCVRRKGWTSVGSFAQPNVQHNQAKEAEKQKKIGARQHASVSY